MTSDQAVHDLVRGLNHAVPDHDRGLDVRPDDARVIADRGVGPDVCSGADYAVLPDRDGPADHASLPDCGALLDPHPPDDLGPLLDGPLGPGLDALEDEVVRLEDVLWAARVLPPAVHEERLHRAAPLPEVVDRLRDLQLVPPRRLQTVDDGEDRGPQEVNPDERQVALRRLRLLDQAHDVALRVEFRDAEPFGVVDRAQ